jgi:hypothetical protein
MASGCAVADKAAVSATRSSIYDGWATEEKLGHIGRVLGVSESRGARPKRPKGRTQHRFDAAHDTVGSHHCGRRAAGPPSEFGPKILGAVAALALMLGLMGSACGGVLLGWAAVMRRDDLWTIGLPVAIGGLLALLVALVLQLDRLSGDQRETVAKLEGFDSRLHQLRRDTAMTGGRNPLAGNAFFSHWSDGGSPQLLLTDLKSQLDLLTRRLGRDEAESVLSDEID